MTNDSTIKKGLLIFPIFTDTAVGKTDGVVVKNQGIENAFRNNGVDVDVMKYYSAGIFCGEQRVFTFSANRYVRGLQLLSSSWNAMGRHAGRQRYDFLWIRLPMVNPSIARFVERFRKEQPQAKIVLEYGAYPYEKELTGWRRNFYRFSKGFERKVHQMADFMITYSDQQQLDGTPVIPIDNGVDLSSIPLATNGSDVQDTVHFISVSSLKRWHAIERFIEGMPGYLAQGKRPAIHFHIVGDGPEHGKLKQLVKDLDLEQHVSFLGLRQGAGMDEAYNGKHIAIGTLGFHRLGLVKSSSLKNREYFGRGLPVVLSTPDEDMPATLPFVQYVAGGEAPLDIAELVDFAQNVYQIPDLRGKIRAYAEEHVSWNSKIQTVLKHLQGKPLTEGVRK
ncbi:MAG: glycosyltransferase [Sphingobacteriales bacterium]|nr:MAG: glycosyltransferase [Sphingobacteriales bacterium]